MSLLKEAENMRRWMILGNFDYWRKTAERLIARIRELERPSWQSRCYDLAMGLRDREQPTPMPPFDYSGYVVGQKAWHLICGEVTIKDVNIESGNILWRFKDNRRYIWTHSNGYANDFDSVPTIWPSRPVIGLAAEQPAGSEDEARQPLSNREVVEMSLALHDAGFTKKEANEHWNPADWIAFRERIAANLIRKGLTFRQADAPRQEDDEEEYANLPQSEGMRRRSSGIDELLRKEEMPTPEPEEMPEAAFRIWMTTDDSGFQGTHPERPTKDERGMWRSAFGKAIVPRNCYPEKGEGPVEYVVIKAEAIAAWGQAKLWRWADVSAYQKQMIGLGFHGHTLMQMLIGFNAVGERKGGDNAK